MIKTSNERLKSKQWMERMRLFDYRKQKKLKIDRARVCEQDLMINTSRNLKIS